MLLEKRIFLVEDNPTNLAVITQILQSHGASVSYDRWGIETTQRILRWRPVDLILLDLMFPGGVSGFDIFRAIRNNPDLQTIPVVVVSANTSGEMVGKAHELGLNGYISKPVSLDTFPHLVLRAIQGEQVWEI